MEIFAKDSVDLAIGCRRVTFDFSMPEIKPEPDPTGLKISVVAVGGRGCNILERLGDLEKKGTGLVAIASAGKVFNRIQVKTKIELPTSGDTQMEKRPLDELESIAKASMEDKAE